MNEISIPTHQMKLDIHPKKDEQRTPDTILANNDYYDMRA